MRIQNFRIYLMAGVALLLNTTAWTHGAQKTSKNPPTTSSASKPPNTISKNPYRGAIVVEALSGKVLFQDGADVKGYPASVLKLMDLLIILEKIDKKELSFQDSVTVSAKSAKTGGSQVYLAEKETFSLDEMLYALMVKSANDAAVALAEKVAESTDGFTVLMNKKAKELGMTSTVFRSVHGLPPAPGQEDDVTTARDLSILCRELLSKYPDTLRYTSTRQRPFRANDEKRKIDMVNHNHLVGRVKGCDGLKTGYIARAGFSIAVTASRNNQRIVAVVLGSVDSKTRDAKARELVEKGFAALEPAVASAGTAGTGKAKAQSVKK
jgi:serine-type D-Ala-D-Ala carboxypeptidase (penicillin-binding protein 5/6)